jgi:hypothetical protein
MFNRIVSKIKKPPPVRLNPEQDAFLGSAIQEFNIKRALALEKYGFDKYSWFFDQESGEFQLKDGARIVHTAEGQIAGSYFKPDGSWEWAWNNPNWKKAFVRDSQLVKEYGKSERIRYFTDGKVSIGNLEFGAYLTAVGVKLSKSDSAYIGDTGDLVVFIMLKNFQ